MESDCYHTSRSQHVCSKCLACEEKIVKENPTVSGDGGDDSEVHLVDLIFVAGR